MERNYSNYSRAFGALGLDCVQSIHHLVRGLVRLVRGGPDDHQPKRGFRGWGLAFG